MYKTSVATGQINYYSNIYKNYTTNEIPFSTFLKSNPQFKLNRVVSPHQSSLLYPNLQQDHIFPILTKICR